MSDRASVAAKRVFELLNSKQGTQLMDAIGELAEALENKADPERTEMYLYNNIATFHEKLGNVKFNLRTYVRETNPLVGDKLSSLYEDTDKIRVNE